MTSIRTEQADKAQQLTSSDSSQRSLASHSSTLDKSNSWAQSATISTAPEDVPWVGGVEKYLIRPYYVASTINENNEKEKSRLTAFQSFKTAIAAAFLSGIPPLASFPRLRATCRRNSIVCCRYRKKRNDVKLMKKKQISYIVKLGNMISLEECVVWKGMFWGLYRTFMIALIYPIESFYFGLKVFDWSKWRMSEHHEL